MNSDDDLVFVTAEELELTRRDLDCAWSELVAEASSWPTFTLDD
jgi:hypothetical protein